MTCETPVKPVTNVGSVMPLTELKRCNIWR